MQASRGGNMNNQPRIFPFHRPYLQQANLLTVFSSHILLQQELLHPVHFSTFIFTIPDLFNHYSLYEKIPVVPAGI